MDSNDNLGTNTNDEILQELGEEILIIYTMIMVACKTHNMFNPKELEEGDQTIINHNVGVTNVLSWILKVSALVRVLTNFEIHKFDEFVSTFCPTIHNNAITHVWRGL